MNVGELQNFLRSLGGLLEAGKGSSAKLGGEFQALCDGLEPFKEQPVSAFAQFLKKAEEYERTDKIPVAEKKPPPKKDVAPKSPKMALKKKEDAQAVAAAATVLQSLYDRGPDPALSYEEIAQEVDRIEAEFDGDGLKAVAKKFGVTSTLKTKKDAKDRILKRITDRKGHSERGEVIARHAASPPVPPPPAPVATEEPDVVVLAGPPP